jgi:dolichyl-phosphate beta-glucosyltransferase
MALATGNNIGFVDADNKTPISEFAKFRPYLESGCDLVIGSRALKESRIERAQCWYRRIGSKGFSVLVRTLLDLHGIRDTQCGFKFFQRHVARDIFNRQKIDGYMFDIEILYLAILLGYKIKQVPVRWKDDADSRLELVKGNIRNVMDVVRIRFTTSKKNF